MIILRNIYNSVFYPLEIMRPKSSRRQLISSCMVVLITAVFIAAAAPFLQYPAGSHELSFSLNNMLIRFMVCIFTWSAACVTIWLLSRSMKKKISLKEIAATWGFSYVPDLICNIVYYIILFQGDMLIISGIAGFLLNAFFIMLLVWKAVYYFMEMKFVIKTSGAELFLITTVLALVFLVLMGAGFRTGIQIPML